MNLLNDPFPKANGLYDPRREKDSCGVGFVANIKGKKSHDIIRDALSILCNLSHRGAAGADPETGDGAGILLQIPTEFFRSAVDFKLPDLFAVGNVFLSSDEEMARQSCELITQVMVDCGLKVIGWREIPVDSSTIGSYAQKTEPKVRQLFVAPLNDKHLFEMNLFRARKRARNTSDLHYFCSLSSKTIVYKGMFHSHQLETYYPDLQDSKMKSAVAIVHQRFSTNTFPSWKLAHPYRTIAHNGEFNTIQGNINMLRAREAEMKCADLGPAGLEDIKPIVSPNQSDSASFDNAVELFLRTGRSLPEVLAMLIPEAWGSRKHMNDDRRDFYMYHANLMEPWDGPAAIASTDGRNVCAILDRNGLRPARFCVTKDDRVIFGSEAGMLKIPDEDIVYKSRLWPGKMINIDLEKGEFHEDWAVKSKFVTKRPYGEWLKKGMIYLEDLPDPIVQPKGFREDIYRFQRAFGYSEEELDNQLKHMALTGQEPVSSMGHDAPIAVVSKRPKNLANYFRQKFAQVTNPPIDPIREEIVMGLGSYFGTPWNLFEDGPEYCHQIRLRDPILTNHQMAQLAYSVTKFLRSTVIDLLFQADDTADNLENALDRIFKTAEERVHQGYNCIILSDRGLSEDKVAVPALLAVSGLHQHLIKLGKRGSIGIIIETGEARTVHHMAVLFAYGASAVNPYLAFASIRHLRDCERLPARDGNEIDYEDPGAYYDRNYLKALRKGLMKIMSKMGISTLRSYIGSQCFEAIGLSQEVVDRYFTGTISTLGGFGLEGIFQGLMARHSAAFGAQPDSFRELEWGGEHRWRPEGEIHALNPETIALLQHAVRQNDYETYKKFSELIHDHQRNLTSIRGMLQFKSRPAIPITEVEPVEEIFKRFCTGAMSLGALSPEAHETLAIAMNKIGGKSNSGEGGEDSARYIISKTGQDRRSAIKQVASGRFGVTPEYLVNASEIQIKVSQGAKPGEGGQLPGHKVTKYIAKLRNSVPGVSLISPPPHHDIYSIEDLAQLIFDLKNVNSEANIAVKLVSEFGVGTVAAGVAKAHADVVVIAGHDGGTAASPLSSIKHTGTPWELGLSETHQTLMINRLRNRIRVQVDGGLRTGRDVAIATMLGAEEYGFATPALISMGCIMMRKCHLDTCPVGIATQNQHLRNNFTGQVEHVINYMRFIAQEMQEIMAQLGFRTINEMVGRSDLLAVNDDSRHWKSQNLDLEKIINPINATFNRTMHQTEKQDHGVENVLDRKLIDLALPTLESNEPSSFDLEISTKNRTSGAMLAGYITKKLGAYRLEAGLLTYNFKGSAGQSFGAFMVQGMEFHLSGEANDYLGKGMAGGVIVVKPIDQEIRKAESNWISGNTNLYGATGGQVYISGRVGERFAVRNSGCFTVVEGVGDHCCEYMTGGCVVILGPTGRNFGAGMSGGIAYIRDQDHMFSRRVNDGMIDTERCEDDDIITLKKLIEKHCLLTGSKLGKRILSEWAKESQHFVKVVPREFRKIMSRKKSNQIAAGEFI